MSKLEHVSVLKVKSDNINCPVYIIKNSCEGYTVVDTYNNTTKIAIVVKARGRITSIRDGLYIRGKAVFTDSGYETDSRKDGDFYVGDVTFTDLYEKKLKYIVPCGFLYVVA